MSREVQVRFCESRGVRFPPATHLPVPEVAAILGRTVHATEALLVRARSAFRAAYADMGGERGDE
jgi:hypothetical protein